MASKEQQIAFLKAFKEVFRAELMDGNVVRLEGLGEFGIQHIPQQEQEQPDGSVMMMPPRKQLQFKPEADL
jgi:nucleoid DNA-binding protein